MLHVSARTSTASDLLRAPGRQQPPRAWARVRVKSCLCCSWRWSCQAFQIASARPAQASRLEARARRSDRDRLSSTLCVKPAKKSACWVCVYRGSLAGQAPEKSGSRFGSAGRTPQAGRPAAAAKTPGAISSITPEIASHRPFIRFSRSRPVPGLSCASCIMAPRPTCACALVSGGSWQPRKFRWRLQFLPLRSFAAGTTVCISWNHSLSVMSAVHKESGSKSAQSAAPASCPAPPQHPLRFAMAHWSSVRYCSRRFHARLEPPRRWASLSAISVVNSSIGLGG
mmetsp:Transcript_72398/g.204641  ORF Transcript_72398/g.204641 Transcript_72398/m.204641 type:complete len:284 (-) Transcript_72398:404-1255(-)